MITPRDAAIAALEKANDCLQGFNPLAPDSHRFGRRVRVMEDIANALAALKQEARGDEVKYWVMGKGVYIAPVSGRSVDAVLLCECATVEQCHAVKSALAAPDERTLPEGWKITSVTLTVVKEGTKFSDMQFFRVNDLSFDAAVLAAVANITSPDNGGGK